jgi:hypothetical protein
MTRSLTEETVVAAALAAVVAGAHAGTSIGELEAAALAAAAAAGCAPGHRFHVSVAQIGGGERLRKSALLIARIRMGIRSSGANSGIMVEYDLRAPILEIARTLVVGFDTMALDVAVADRAVRALSVSFVAAHAGATTESIGRAAAAVVPSATLAMERRGPAGDARGEALAAGDIAYLEVSLPHLTAQPEPERTPGGDPAAPRSRGSTRVETRIVLGDTVRVLPDRSEPIGSFALRLWL